MLKIRRENRIISFVIGVVSPEVTKAIEEVAALHCELELLDERLYRRDVPVESYGAFLQRGVFAIV